MNTAAQFFKTLIRICGGAALILGLAFWLGYGWSFTRLHMDLGMTVVVSLWVLAGLGWRNGAPAGLVAFAAAWGVLTWFVGFNQLTLLPGSLHWVVAVVHLLLGVTSIALGIRLAAARSPSSMQSRAQTTDGRQGIAG